MGSTERGEAAHSRGFASSSAGPHVAKRMECVPIRNRDALAAAPDKEIRVNCCTGPKHPQPFTPHATVQAEKRANTANVANTANGAVAPRTPFVRKLLPMDAKPSAGLRGDFWSAAAERSADAAFGRPGTSKNAIRRPSQSGVALRLPPYSTAACPRRLRQGQSNPINLSRIINPIPA